ncbi:putative cyclase-domain-containing protein [Flammula alnicola]|nr:putative cyclase-domain-containing protein [Flammula alnicola]
MAAPSPFDDVQFPPLSSLPFREGDPKGAIWGFYEHISQSTTKDELGSINLLTPSRILRASQIEIKHGRLCSLNWELHKPFPAGYQRKGLEHRVFQMTAVKATYTVDDEVSMNTQCGSQWDGLKHWSYYETGQIYNDLPVSEVLDLQAGSGKGKACAFDEPARNGIHVLQGKIAGRGILLDYFSYSQENGVQYAPNDCHLVTAKDLENCAKAQGVTFEQGDILFVRMGFVNWYETATKEEKEEFAKPPQAVGIRQGMEEVEWLWDHHFAAVASDSPAFEARPNKLNKWNLHDYLLALWGTPMGELFDLEELSRICKELGRYSFFVTSSPLNIVNGIASPPNALAIS